MTDQETHFTTFYTFSNANGLRNFIKQEEIRHCLLSEVYLMQKTFRKLILLLSPFKGIFMIYSKFLESPKYVDTKQHFVKLFKIS